jgi:hypothetical protein
MAMGNGNHLWLLVAIPTESIIFPLQREGGGIKTGKPIKQLQIKCNAEGYLRKELCRAVFKYEVQSFPERIVIKIITRQTMTQQAFNRFSLKEFVDQIEGAVGKPEPVEDHGTNTIPNGHTPGYLGFIPERLVDAVTQGHFTQDAGDDSKMIKAFGGNAVGGDSHG